LQQVAAAATAALHRRVTPAGTSLDGDVVFALSPIGDAGGSAAAAVEGNAISGSAAGGDAGHSAGGPPHRDIVSAPAPDHHPSSARRAELPPAALMQVEALAVAALECAIERAVRLARGRDGIPGIGDGADRGAHAGGSGDAAGAAEQRREVLGGEDGGAKRRSRRRHRS
jgi:L-aminopeptidase/D-esterase-like protein